MPTADGGECVAANPCIDEGTCQQGFCTGALRVCDDTDSCTVDSCDPATGACSADACVDYGNTGVTATLTAGVDYFVVVDGYQGAAGTYDLTVTCPSSRCRFAAGAPKVTCLSLPPGNSSSR